MKRWLIGIATVALLHTAACSDIRTEANPAKLLGRTMQLPDGEQKWIVSGRDTTMAMPLGIKIVVYYNNQGCTSCRLKQLGNWQVLIDELRRIKDRESLHVDFVFIVQTTPDDESLQSALQRQQFDAPVLCDADGVFERENILPENGMYHTFLLNKNNQILQIGAPIFSPRLWDKYKASIRKTVGL